MTALSIANRILLGFAAVILAVIVLGFFVLDEFADVRTASTTIVARDVAVLRQLDRLGDTQRDMQVLQQTALVNYLLQRQGQAVAGGDPVGDWRRQVAQTDAVVAEITGIANEYRARAINGRRAEAWRRLSVVLGQWAGELRQLRQEAEQQFQALQQNDLARALGFEQSVSAHRAAIAGLHGTANDAVAGAIEAGSEQVSVSYRDARNYVLAAIAVVVVLGLLVTFAIRRSITGPLTEFAAFVERVGRGELAGARASEGPNELGQLGGHLNAMVEGLRDLARQSREATENLNAAVAEIRASAQEQAAGVEEQLAAVQETAATIEEITHGGAQINNRAREVIGAAQETVRSSTAGVAAVEETVRSMDSIRDQAEAVAANIVALSERTQAVSDIILTVSDVSERSHLLALNAAIEAASAGEQGRRFGVVAAEMKSLADQAKDATVQVRSILGDIQRGIASSVMLTEEAVKRVATGKSTTDATLSTINEMSESIQESVQTFQQIVASTNQQQLGVEQVMLALQNIRQASQQTASGTRQLEGAAGNLNSLSSQLLELAARYRL